MNDIKEAEYNQTIERLWESNHQLEKHIDFLEMFTAGLMIGLGFPPTEIKNKFLEIKEEALK